MSQQLPLVAIVGRPNVGKSSLFNRLSQSRQAIVAKASGTTRDNVQRLIKIRGRSFCLVDTAGLFGGDDLETSARRQIAQQIEEALSGADLILVVFSADTPLSAADRQILKKLYRAEKPVIGVINKIDQTGSVIPPQFTKLGRLPMLGTATTTGHGILELQNQLLKHLPRTRQQPSTAAGIAIVGRPNVGKSSLFNQLVGQNKAVVSTRARTTRDVNWTAIRYQGRTYNLFDTAGIRKTGKRRGIESFSYLRTLAAINQAEVAILVVDSTEPSVKTDQAIAGLVKDSGKGLLLALNKWDLIDDHKHQRLAIEQKLQADFGFVWWAPVVFISARTGQNTQKLFELAQNIIHTRQRTYPTAQLNQIISQAVAYHQPPLQNRRRPQLLAVRQTGVKPPRFVISGHRLRGLHWSYQRYLEAKLRGELDLMGTPIRLDFKDQTPGAKS